MKPLLLNFAQERKSAEAIKYHYDYSESYSVINVNNQNIPLVESDLEENILLTKTRVTSERDDDQFLSLQTKTKVKNERDDEDSKQILSLMTKTLTRQESDDK